MTRKEIINYKNEALAKLNEVIDILSKAEESFGETLRYKNGIDEEMEYNIVYNALMSINSAKGDLIYNS